ncbi:MAG: Uma2 family endonuclease [Planctomycetota bacterium]
MTRDEFERRYNRMPDVKKAELIEGIVYMPSPVSHTQHGRPHRNVITWLGVYNASTPGIEGGDNGTVRLDKANEPQPDAYLFISRTCGGQARLDADDYVEGAPELVVEIAATSASRDLHAKLNVYLRNGVKEYIVWRVLEQAIDWFVLRGGKYERLVLTKLRAGVEVYKSETFPGLWLDPAALLKDNLAAVLDVLRKGLASSEHAAFVARLQEAKEKKR